MKIESTSFTHADLSAFMRDLMDHERHVLIARLDAATNRLAGVAATLDETKATEGDGGAWTAREILAHIAAFSHFYGVLAYKIAQGQIASIDLLAAVRQRDPLIEQMRQQSLSALLSRAQAEHRRTLAFLRAADPLSLRRAIPVGGTAHLSADDALRLLLCAHLEQHIADLAALA